MEKLIHLLVPRQSNNQKAGILHTTSLFVISILLIVFQLVLNYVPKTSHMVLGFASNISVGEVVRLTNLKRSEVGLPALTFNQTLANAAYAKGVDMINNDYWAHVAPDGTQPWTFFKNAGYKYKFAGENLARDFSNATEAVDAWMNSPTHRDNLLNSKYKEIGIGVVEGDLSGSDTTIIVQFFGTAHSDQVREPIAQALSVEMENTPVPTVIPSVIPNIVPNVNSVETIIENPDQDQQVLVSPFTTTRNASLIVVGILLLVFMVDAFLVSKRRITRIAGRTFAHLVFLVMILLIIIILKSGQII